MNVVTMRQRIGGQEEVFQLPLEAAVNLLPALGAVIHRGGQVQFTREDGVELVLSGTDLIMLYLAINRLMLMADEPCQTQH